MSCHALPEFSGGCGSSIAPWLAYGLPAGSIEGYRVASDPGLVRTQFDDGSVRQRMRWYGAPRREIQITWPVREEELQTLEAWLDVYGYDWHVEPLTTGAIEGAAVEHTVRLTSSLEITPVNHGLYQVSATAELAP